MGFWTGLMIALVTLAGGRWLLQPSARPTMKRDGVSIVCHGARFRWLLWGAVALFLGHGVHSYFTYDGEFPQLRAIPLQGAIVMTLLVCVPMALLVYRSWVRYDEQSVTFGRALRPRATVRWEEVTSAQWTGRQSLIEPMSLRIEWGRGHHTVGPWLDGFGDFVAALRARGIEVARVPWEGR